MENSVALEVKNLQVLYGDKHVVHDVSMKFPANKITAMIGLLVQESQHCYEVLTG